MNKLINLEWILSQIDYRVSQRRADNISQIYTRHVFIDRLDHLGMFNGAMDKRFKLLSRWRRGISWNPRKFLSSLVIGRAQTMQTQFSNSSPSSTFPDPVSLVPGSPCRWSPCSVAHLDSRCMVPITRFSWSLAEEPLKLKLFSILVMCIIWGLSIILS